MIARMSGYGQAFFLHLVSSVLSSWMETRSWSLVSLMKRTICGVYINAVCSFHVEERRHRIRLYFCFATLSGSWLLMCVRASDLEGTIGCTLTLPEHESYLNKTYIKFGSYLTANVWCLQCRNKSVNPVLENNNSYGSHNETHKYVALLKCRSFDWQTGVHIGGLRNFEGFSLWQKYVVKCKVHPVVCHDGTDGVL
jgi:hypothetical protein